MIPVPPPIEYAITIETPKVWDNFEVTYDAILSILNRVEQQGIDHLDETQINQLRKAVVHLSKLGTSKAGDEENALLTRDIIQLFVDDEDDDDLELFELAPHLFDQGDYVIPSAFYGNDACIIPCKSLKKKLKKCAHKVEKFCREHKKAIIIGAVAAVAIGVTVYFVIQAGQSAALAAAAGATGAAAGDPPNKHHREHEEAKADEVHEVSVSAAESSSEPVPAIVEEIQMEEKPMPQPLPPPPPEPESKNETKEICSHIVHEVWEGIGEVGDVVDQISKEIKMAAKAIDIDIRNKAESTLLNPQEDWRDTVQAGHEKIDEWFDTNQAEYYEHESFLDKHAAIGELPPPPLGALGQAGEVAKIAEGVVASEELVLVEQRAAAVESRLATIENPPLIEPVPTGVWHLEGNNIKSVDWGKMMHPDRIDHIFGKVEHNLHLLEMPPEAAYKKITEAVVEADRAGKIPSNKHFHVRVMVNSYEVEVRGKVLNGELRYSTIFIPEA